MSPWYPCPDCCGTGTGTEGCLPCEPPCTEGSTPDSFLVEISGMSGSYEGCTIEQCQSLDNSYVCVCPPEQYCIWEFNFDPQICGYDKVRVTFALAGGVYFVYVYLTIGGLPNNGWYVNLGADPIDCSGFSRLEMAYFMGTIPCNATSALAYLTSL